MEQEKYLMRWFFALLIIISIAACTVNRTETETTDIGANSVGETPFPDLSNAPDAAIDTEGVVPGNEAIIESVEVGLMESFPVQANVVVRGQLPDSCTTIDQVAQATNGTTFEIVISTIRQTGTMCAEQPQSFEEVISLDILGATAGEYQVNVTSGNTAGNTFALTIDNVAPESAAIEATAPAGTADGGTLTGIVWNDSCPVDGGSDCIADGLMTPAEARITGVEVTLLLGECPGGGEPVAITQTDDAGTYIFNGLKNTTYCVSIAPFSASNAPVLSTGNWSYPGVGVGNTTVTLAENDYQSIDFGWDYRQSSPPAVATTEAVTEPPVAEPSDCTTAAAYISDVTIPDGTVMSSGEPFVKTWRIKNEGTCTWDTSYNLVFESGDPMSSPPTVALDQTVPPGDEVDISISLVAPEAAGTYQSDWLLQAPTGSLFGSRGDFPFYVQVVVSP
jgi:hypothetical protein